MKALIIYYSHSGNTASVVHDFADILRNRNNEVQAEKLKYKKEKSGLVARLFYRFTHKFVELEPIIKDVSNFDLLILGIPVIGGKPSAAMSRYLDLLTNVDKIKVIACYVYGFEINAKKCSSYLQNLLIKKGQDYLTEVFIPWTEVLDKELVKKKINQSLDDIG